jgi:hypothetical protein
MFWQVLKAYSKLTVCRSCEAIGPSRRLIKRLLEEIYETLRIRNTLRAISILETFWNQSIIPNVPASEESMDKSLDPWQAWRIADTDAKDFLDFIPY